MTRDQFFTLLDQHAGPGVQYEIRHRLGWIVLVVEYGTGEDGKYDLFDLEPYCINGNPDYFWSLVNKYRSWLHDWRRERTAK